MTFRQFAFNNVFRNKRLYIAYFLSSLFTVAVFFTFANFAFHPALTGENMRGDVTRGMMVAGTIIYVFSFFFLLYSMSSFLQSRKREFGLLMIQGMSNSQIRWMVFLENMIIGFFATIVGMGLGLVFSKLILLIAENLLQLNETLQFYFPTWALLITFGSFMVLFFFISVFVTFILRTKRLVKLIKGDKIGKSEPKASIILTVIAVVLLGTGYGIALYVEGPMVVIALFPVAILVTIGTYLLFSQVSVFVMKRLKANQSLFWRKTNMLLFSDLAYRMKDNARAFFMVAIISTVAFSAIGTLVGLNSYLTSGLKQANPISFLGTWENEKDADQDSKTIEQTFDQHHLTVEKATAQLTFFEQEGGPGMASRLLITTPDMYNAFARLVGEKEIILEKGQVTAVEQSTTNILPKNKNLGGESITLEDGTKLSVDEQLLGIAKPEVLPEMFHYFIVDYATFAQLPEPSSTEKAIGWQVVKGKEADIIAAGRDLNGEVFFLMAVDYIIDDIQKMYSPIMFVGLFIGIVFFVSAGSFLYFRLYTDLDEDKTKFHAISKIGLTGREMNRVISKQIFLLFFAPIVVALIHGAVALTALSHMFGYDLFQESVLVLGSFLVIQIVYFIVVRYFYARQVRRFVQR